MRRSKIARLPAEIRDWLCEELRARGFADYDLIAEALNARLLEEGLEVSIGRTAVMRFAREHKKFADLQREADAWAEGFMAERGVEDEARRHQILSAMLSTHAFRSMAAAMDGTEEETEAAMDPRDLQLLGRMLKDLMSSSGIREALSDKERERLIAEERRSAGHRAEEAAVRAGLSPQTIARLRAQVEGAEQDA